MRRFSFREIARTLMLCTASVNLGISSGLVWFGLAFAVAFAFLFFRSGKSPVPVYRKSIAYGLIVPFAIWWVLSPEAEYGMSPWLVFIPAYYLLSLAFLQKRSEGNGGYDVFVLFNGVAVLLLSCYMAPPPSLVANLVVLLLLIHAYGRPGVALWKHVLFLLLFCGFTAISLGGLRYWKGHYRYNGSRAMDFYASRHLMGFNPVVKLGSFESNFSGRYNDQVVLRVWDSLPPAFLRAAVYEKYVGGFWKLQEDQGRCLYPARYVVDHAVFEVADSAASEKVSRMVWVQSQLDNFGFLFAAPGAVGVAAKNADSLMYQESGVFSKLNGNRSDWYYFVPKDGPIAVADRPRETDTLVPPALKGFLDSVSVAVGLKGSAVDYNVAAIGNFFAGNFAYSLVLPKSSKDPLRTFWEERAGYCEYFATMTVLLLRHQGIPARYVTGFARPEHRPGRPYAVFRRNSSHAWAEVYDGAQWRGFDPTPPIFVVKPPASSRFSLWWESVRGRAAYMFHLLKDGEWRLALSSWQDTTQAWLASPLFYAVLALLALSALAFRFRHSLRRRTHANDYAESVRKLVHGLDMAERLLSRIGLHRLPGETVGAFLARCRLTMPDTKREFALWKKAMANLQDYEANRWR